MHTGDETGFTSTHLEHCGGHGRHPRRNPRKDDGARSVSSVVRAALGSVRPGVLHGPVGARDQVDGEASELFGLWDETPQVPCGGTASAVFAPSSHPNPSPWGTSLFAH